MSLQYCNTTALRDTAPGRNSAFYTTLFLSFYRVTLFYDKLFTYVDILSTGIADK